MIPTLLYWAGVPVAAKPCLHVTPSGAADELAGELDPQLEKSTARQPIATGASRDRFTSGRHMCMFYHPVGSKDSLTAPVRCTSSQCSGMGRSEPSPGSFICRAGVAVTQVALLRCERDRPGPGATRA